MTAAPPANGRSNAQSAVDRAYEHTKAQIVEGRLPPGEWLSEGEIAQALSVSRTPVREAFLRLQSEGMLRLYPRKGAVVVPLSDRDVEEMMQLREMAEGFAGRQVLALEDDELAEVIAGLDRLMDEQRAAGAGDPGRFVVADREFHAAVVRAAGNALLDAFYASLRDKQERMGQDALRRDPARLRSILAEHAELVDRLRERDAAGYEAALAAHLEGSRKLLRKANHR